MEHAPGPQGYLNRMQSIGGWFSRLDAEVMLCLTAAQEREGTRGDLLEIGVFEGKSAILLGFAPAEGERLHVCDPFDHLEVEEAATISERYVPPSRVAFEERYRREHDALPVIHECLSTELGARLTPRSFRFVHVDGGHRYEDARRDLDRSLDLLVAGGIVCFDDYRTVVTPGVALAVWEAVAAGRLTVVALTGAKCYCVARGDRAAARLQSSLRDDDRLDGEPYDLDDDVPALGVWFAGGQPEGLTGAPGSSVAPARSPWAVIGTRVLERLPDGVTRSLRSIRYRVQARRAHRASPR